MKNSFKIVYKKIADLVLANYNPRKIGTNERKELTKSIKKFGFVENIVVNKNTKRKNVVIGGHQRLKVAQDLGIDSVPCIELDLPLEKEKELNLRLNKNRGSFDDKLLMDFDKKLLEEVGFADKELQKVFSDEYGVEGEEEFTTEIMEENNYVVAVFDNSVDWLAISSILGLKSVSAKDSKADYKRKGVGRVIDGKKLLKLIK